jgi:two-component system nitrogen regulation response regulator NtrX
MSGEQILVSDIPVEFMLNDETDLQNYRGLPLKEFREIVEKDYIIRILKNTNGNISKASRILKIDRTYLHKKMSQFDISKRDYF